MQQNIVIFVIIIVLFAVLAGIGVLIWYLQTGFGRGARSISSDSEA